MNSRVLTFVPSIPLLLCLLVSASTAQNILRPAPFTLSSRDTTQASLLPKLPAGPAGSNGKLHLDADGHIVGEQGNRLKLFGTELQWTAQFISGDDSRTLAKRLRKFGFNAVRLLYNDYFGWDDASLMMTRDGTGQYNTSSYVVNPLQLARLDTLMFELKQNGLHLVLPLNSIHSFSYGEGIPYWDSSYGNNYLWSFLYPRAAELQHQWARSILAHKNPLTGLTLANDPALALVELNWEHSLFYYWRFNKLNYIDAANVLNQGVGTLPYHASRRLDTLYSSYLQKKYGSDANLNAAWVGPIPTKTNLLINGSFEQAITNNWSLLVDQSAGAKATLSLFGPGKDSDVCAWIRIEKASSTMDVGQILLANNTATCKRDSLYELSFWAKVKYDNQKKIVTRAAAAVVLPEQRTYQADLAQPFTVDTTWKKYSYKFRCTMAGIEIIAIGASNELGDLLIDAVSLTRATDVGLLTGESLATATVKRLLRDSLPAANPLRARDQVMFYDSLERAFWEPYTRLISDTIAIKGLVNHSQTNWWATLNDFHAGATSPVIESHQGWDYVSQRGSTAYTDTNWMVRNTSSATNGGIYTIALAAAASTVGKAFMLGQFQIPYANQYAAEHAVMLPAIASYQDWDGIFFSPYAGDRNDLFIDTLPAMNGRYAWNNISANHSLMSMMPIASSIFREGLIAPAGIMDTVLHDPSDIWLSPVFSDYRHPYGVEGYLDPNITMTSKIRQRYESSRHKVAAQYSYTPDTTALMSDTKELIWAQSSGFGILGEKVIGLTAPLGSDTIEFPMLTLHRSDNSRDEFSFLMIAQDSLPIASSHKTLMTIATRTQNTGMQWADSMGFSYHFGHGPTVISAVKLDLAIKSSLDSVLIYPLDSTGNLRNAAPITATRIGTTNWFNTTIDQQKTPSAWFVIEHKAAIPQESVAKITNDLTLEVAQAIDRSSIEITVSTPTASSYGLTIVDDLGRTVRSVVNERESLGKSRYSVDARSLPSGHYLVRLTTPTGSLTRPVVVLK